VWQPPGVIFSCLKKDHHSHGRSLPPWSEWGFVENDIPRRLVLGALGGRWAIWQAGHRQQERWFVADGDDSRVFNSFIRAMNFYGLDPQEPESSFPNLRILHTHERSAPRFFPPGVLRSVHVHMPWPARASKPIRAALITPSLIADAYSALE
ncbi:unnamed protein product, partial [Polarella glacialis]